jgi:hypothetical protein
MEYRPLAKYEVVKHIGAIHISNTLSLLERKVSNVLLRNAWDNLLDSELHTISIQELADAVGFNSKDLDLIKKALGALVSTAVEWNILSRDRKNAWGKAAILSSVQIVEGTGVCEYTYPLHLRKMLRNPNIFARLNLLIQRQFDSKYSLALWEFASGELSLSGEIAPHEEYITDWLALDTLRMLLGSEEPAYREVKEFRQKVLKPAIAEVNRVSNLEITDTEARRENRKITALRFTIAPKETYQLPLDLEVPALLETTAVSTIPQAANDEKAELVRQMVEMGVNGKAAQGIARAYGVDRITENLEWAVAQIHSGRDIKRPGAFVASAIRNDYIEPERLKRKKVRQLRIDRETQERDQKELAALVEKMEGDFWLYRVGRVDAIRAAFTDEKHAAFERLMVERDVFRTPSRWEEYRKNGLAAAPERSLFYAFAMRELLQPEERDILRYAQEQGVAADVLAALKRKGGSGA